MVLFVLACVAGCLVRYSAELVAERFARRSRAWGTLAVNIAGSAIVGFTLTHVVHHAQSLVPFCGGLTSFSAAFAGPLQLWSEGSRRAGSALLIATPLVCAGSCFFGAGL